MNQAIFDWNQGIPGGPGDPRTEAHELGFGRLARGVKVVDETLRDGLQTVSGIDPPVSHKIDLLHAMARIGVDVVSVGLPAAGPKTSEDSYLLCREIARAKLPLVPTGAARTVVSDVEGIARVADRAGMAIEVYAFIGSSPIRHFVEGWDLAFLLDRIRTATEAATRANLPFCLVTEDTTRSRPDVLRAMFRAALDAGASRLCLCDTTGHITPYGVDELVTFARREIEASGRTGVELDWHGHNDRGLAVPTALWAASVGVERIHGTGLAIGERVGNASIELLIENLGLLGARPRVPADRLREFVALTARALSWAVPPDHPIAGDRALREQQGPRPYRVIPKAPPSRPQERLVPISFRVGAGAKAQRVDLAVHPRRTLLEALRYDLDMYGTKQGCDKGDCGACTVVLNGQAVLSCLTLAVEADGGEVQTVETLDGAPHLDPIVDCFDKVGGGQCGFCTPGMLMSATALLGRDETPSREAIKLAISGNLCRCTGYGRIVDAIELAAKIRRGEESGGGDLPGAECAPPPLPSNTRTREEKR